MTTIQPTVFVVDDDPAMRESLCDLISSVRLSVKSYESARGFLEAYDSGTPGCLLLDVRMPGMSGIDLQDKLREQKIDIPLIIITGHADIPLVVRAMHNGAIDVFEKPFRGQMLIDSISRAIDRDTQARIVRSRQEEIAARYARLTPRERNVVDLLMEGTTTKQIARKLAVTSQAIDAHRNRAMTKLEVHSIAELVKNGMIHSAGQVTIQ